MDNKNKVLHLVGVAFVICELDQPNVLAKHVCVERFDMLPGRRADRSLPGAVLGDHIVDTLRDVALLLVGFDRVLHSGPGRGLSGI